MVGQAVKAAQVAQHHFTGNIGTDADDFKVHHCADLPVFVRHGSLNLCALFCVARLQGFVYHVAGQVVCQFRQVVRIQIFHGGNQLARVHCLNQAFAHDIGHFQKHVAVFFGHGQPPHQHALFGRQVFQNGGNVGGMQFVQDAD